MSKWSSWRKFPDPRKNENLHAPFGPGVYELRDVAEGIKVLVGKGRNLAHRMSSLLPKPYGCGTRHNLRKRRYVLRHIEHIEYRTIACDDIAEASAVEREYLRKYRYKFPT